MSAQLSRIDPETLGPGFYCPYPAHVSGYRRQRRKRGRRWDKGQFGWWGSLNKDQRRHWRDRWREIERERRLRDLWMAERAWSGRESNERGRHR